MKSSTTEAVQKITAEKRVLKVSEEKVSIKKLKLHPIFEEMKLSPNEMFGNEAKYFKNRLGQIPKPFTTRDYEIITNPELYHAAIQNGWNELEVIVTDLTEDEVLRKINFSQMLSNSTDTAKYIIIKNLYENIETPAGKEWFDEVETEMKKTMDDVKTADVIGRMMGKSSALVKNLRRFAETGEKIYNDAFHYFELKGDDGKKMSAREKTQLEIDERKSYEIMESVVPSEWKISKAVENAEFLLNDEYMIWFKNRKDGEELAKQVFALIEDFRQTHKHTITEDEKPSLE